eukprot:1757149-Pleurochrysis_carterae.AAC.3
MPVPWHVCDECNRVPSALPIRGRVKRRGRRDCARHREEPQRASATFALPMAARSACVHTHQEIVLS